MIRLPRPLEGLAGIGLAIVGNFLRSLYLSYTAHKHGLAALHGAHDSAGWSILIFTACGLIAAAWLMVRLEKLVEAEHHRPT